MRKESFQGILLGVVIMCAVFAFITVAWAAFSSTLTIGGTAKVEASNWYVGFSNDGSKLTASATVNGTAGTTISGATTGATAKSLTIAANGQDVTSADLGTLSVPGDTLTYEWKVINAGTFDANVSSLTNVTEAGVVTLQCTYKDGTAGDANAFCTSYVKAELIYDSSSHFVTTTPATKLNKMTGTTITAKDVKLVITYDATISADNLPNKEISVALGNGTKGIEIGFTQA